MVLSFTFTLFLITISLVSYAIIPLFVYEEDDLSFVVVLLAVFLFVLWLRYHPDKSWRVTSEQLIAGGTDDFRNEFEAYINDDTILFGAGHRGLGKHQRVETDDEVLREPPQQKLANERVETRNWETLVRGRTQMVEEQGYCLRKYSLGRIRIMTEDFKDSNFLGEGGFGTVYKGVQTDGTMVAIKRLKRREGRFIDDFKNEVEALGRTSHFNLVKLIGYCVEDEHRMLVYKYISNGTLEQWIFGNNPRNSLSWVEKKRIIKGIAKGLVYLHENCEMKILHLDLKPANILLDDKMNAKLGDFGLSRILERDQSSTSAVCYGTPGYMAPEIMKRGRMSEKVDVYSFGVVVLKIVFGKKYDNLDSSNQNSLKADQFPSLIMNLGDEMRKYSKEIEILGNLALLCLSDKPSDRPKMSEVLRNISDATTVITKFKRN